MVSRRFLLVSLHIDAILGEVTIRQRRKKLEEMTQGNGLGDAYTGTLTRLKAQKGNKSILGLKVLMWVLYSERPLQAEELRHALGVEIGSVDLDLENVPTLRTILASSLGLVTVEASSSTVRLVHFTLQEHLLGDPTLFYNSHSAIAEVCLTYLNFRCVRALSPTLLSAPAATPLLKYASCYWAQHARRGMTENVKMLALRLLDGFEAHISAQLMLLDYMSGRGFRLDLSLEKGHRGFTGLHGAAFLGITPIFAAVLRMKEWDVNAGDSVERGAVKPRFKGLWRALIKRSHHRPGYTDPDLAVTIYGRTPLLWAAERGNEEVAKMLLTQQGINPDLAGTGWTPLLSAAKHGHGGVVKMLLELEIVDPNRADTQYGRTSLSWAAGHGHEGIVKMLLAQRDVDPDAADKCGRTPLSWAAGGGCGGIVKMLLERKDVNHDQSDTGYGRTPLSWAAEGGHQSIVNMFSQLNDVCPGMAEEQPQAPPPSAPPKLSGASVDNYLEPGNVDSEAASSGGQASLSSPAQPCDQCPVDIRFTLHRRNTDITNNQRPLSQADSDELEQVLSLVPVSTSLDNELRANEPSIPSQAASLWSRKFPFSLRKSESRPSNTPPTLPIVLNRYRVICSCLSLVALLTHRKSWHNQTSCKAAAAAFAKFLRFLIFSFLRLGLRYWRRQDLGRSRRK